MNERKLNCTTNRDNRVRFRSMYSYGRQTKMKNVMKTTSFSRVCSVCLNLSPARVSLCSFATVCD